MFSPTARRRIKKLVLWTEVLIILGLVAAGSVVLGAVYQFNKLLPPPEAIDRYRPPVGTRIFSSDGVLLARLATQNREPVKLDQVPENLRNAIVAVEDRRFYQHRGLDYRGIARALWVNLQGGETSQGASTITQQLARNMFLNQRREISRKIKEVLLAVQIERNWTKRQILQGYMNLVYFGSGAYGVKTAARTYFGKELKDLKLEECALLAGLIQRPSELSPFRVKRTKGTLKGPKARRDTVLDLMLDNGFIKPDAWKKARETPVQVALTRPKAIGYFRAHYAVKNAIEELRERYGLDEDDLANGGYKITLTVDMKMQSLAEQVMRDGIRGQRWRNLSEGALVCVDPHTGYVRSVVGGIREPWEKWQFDCATQAHRQPGSTFKGIVYAAAIERHDKNAYSSVQAAGPRIRLGRGRVWTPHNHGGMAGPISYVSAFAGSVNGAAVNVYNQRGVAGRQDTLAIARKMGIKSKLRPVISLALGTSEVTVLEMASAYGIFAAGGRRATPTFIQEIRDLDNQAVDDVKPEVKSGVLSSRTVANMNILTRAVVTSGTGKAASGVPDARGKTGTTEDYTDAWFVGYTPDLCTAIWAGNRDNSRMRSGYGGEVCTPLWARFMRQAIELNPARREKVRNKALLAANISGKKPGEAAVPAGNYTGDDAVKIRICSTSGSRARRGCTGTRQSFAPGTEPTAWCTVHGSSSRRRRSDSGRRRRSRRSESTETPGGRAPAADSAPAAPAVDSPGQEAPAGDN